MHGRLRAPKNNTLRLGVRVMPRSARSKSSTGIYHVMLRGVNKQTIFADDDDNSRFLQALGDCKKLGVYELFGYCLMSNHVHLLVKETDETIGQLVKRLASRYVYWFNRRYDRCGHLFQERFKSEVVEGDRYFAAVLRYIHQNPVKAGICGSIGEYKWSSYNDYISQSSFINPEIAMGIIGESEFEKFMIFDDSDTRFLDYMSLNSRLSDIELSKKIEAYCGVKAIMVQNLPQEAIEIICRSTLKIDGVSVRQLSRVTGISENKLCRL